MLPLGSTCPPPVLSPTLKTGKFPQGAALARISTSGSLSPLQVPRPRPSAARQPPAAGQGAFLQPSTPQLPPHSGHLTPWPASQPSQSAGEIDEVGETQPNPTRYNIESIAGILLTGISFLPKTPICSYYALCSPLGRLTLAHVGHLGHGAADRLMDGRTRYLEPQKHQFQCLWAEI